MLYRQKLQEVEKESALLNNKLHGCKYRKDSLLSPFTQSISLNKKIVLIKRTPT